MNGIVFFIDRSFIRAGIDPYSLREINKRIQWKIKMDKIYLLMYLEKMYLELIVLIMYQLIVHVRIVAIKAFNKI